jgi:transcriptional regulator with XRE-family HTH domain
MKNEETAKRLKFAMDACKLTAKQLSDKSGVSEPSISQYLHGTFAPKNKTAAKLAKVLHVNPMWLMGFDVPSTDYAYDFLQKMEDGSIRMDIKPNQAFVKDIDEITLKMTPEQMNNILQYAKFIKSSSEDKKDET